MEKRVLKKRHMATEGIVEAMSAATCSKYCANKASCGCGSMPGEYNSSYQSSKSYHFSGQYDLYWKL